LIVSVGWLIERKGHHLIIEALVNLPEVTLAIIGSGPDEAKLKRLAAEFGVEERVRFIGTQTQQQINQWFKAADAAILASSREGWANVLLEAMASGTPVVATKVWGTPEVVASEDVGVLVERSAKDIADGVRHIFSKKVNRTVVRKYAEKFNWDSTSDGQYSIFREITKK
jgi:glycosyltransferase involved in cell wall biosynthesis